MFLSTIWTSQSSWVPVKAHSLVPKSLVTLGLQRELKNPLWISQSCLHSLRNDRRWKWWWSRLLKVKAQVKDRATSTVSSNSNSLMRSEVVIVVYLETVTRLIYILRTRVVKSPSTKPSVSSETTLSPTMEPTFYANRRLVPRGRSLKRRTRLTTLVTIHLVISKSRRAMVVLWPISLNRRLRLPLPLQMSFRARVNLV